MKKAIADKIIKHSQKEIKKLAKKNGWMWFYNLHQIEVAKFAEKLLSTYKKADREIVLISCWLHDIAHYYARNSKEILEVKASHHIKGAQIAEGILKQYQNQVSPEEIEKIKRCILCHRNKLPYQPKTIEEKIMAVADTMSHFGSVFYFTYFKFHPEHSLERMVTDDLAKIKRDWRDIQLLPEAKKFIEPEYRMIKKLLENYGK
jgi:putative nucleotidyltransferase with HDIG domain